MQSLCANLQAYGGLDIVMVGDFFQLMPPGGKAVFELGEGAHEDYGRSLWLSVNTCIELTELNRCKDADLAIVLNAIRTGQFTSKANELIHSRVLGSATKAHLTIPTQSTCILQWNTDVNDHNFMAPHFVRGKKVYRLSADIIIKSSKFSAPANHPIFSEAVAAGTPRDGHLPHLDIIIGSKVSILNGNKHLNATGVGNGSSGIVCGVLPHDALNNCVQKAIILPDGCGTETNVWIPVAQVTHILIKIIEDKIATENDIDDGRYDPRTHFRYPGLPPNVFADCGTYCQRESNLSRTSLSVSYTSESCFHCVQSTRANSTLRHSRCSNLQKPSIMSQPHVCVPCKICTSWTSGQITIENNVELFPLTTVMNFLRGVEKRTLAALAL